MSRERVFATGIELESKLPISRGSACQENKREQGVGRVRRWIGMMLARDRQLRFRLDS
eukprot:gene26467-biopygen16578